MNSQQIGDAALSIFQANRKSPEMESLLDAFFSFPTSNEYDDQLRLVSEEMAA